MCLGNRLCQLGWVSDLVCYLGFIYKLFGEDEVAVGFSAVAVVRTFPISSFPAKGRESVSNNSCVRKAVHNKDIMKNITLIHIDLCFVC